MTQFLAIATHLGKISVDVVAKSDACVLSHKPERGNAFREEFAQIDLAVIERAFAAWKLRDIEDVIDHQEQVTGCIMNVVGVVGDVNLRELALFVLGQQL